MATQPTSLKSSRIKTARVQGRRQLHFNSLAEMLADAEQLAAAKQVEGLGNWTLGQAFDHLAISMNLSIDGAKARVPLPLRLLGPLIKKRILKRTMSAGFNTFRPYDPKPEVVPAEGVARMKAAIARLADNPHREPHIIFGRLSREEYDQLHLRHAELHLSFFRPRSG